MSLKDWLKKGITLPFFKLRWGKGKVTEVKVGPVRVKGEKSEDILRDLVRYYDDMVDVFNDNKLIDRAREFLKRKESK